MTGLCDSALTLFPAAAFYSRAAASPRIMRTLLERTQTALFRCRDKAVNLGRKTARERLAGFKTPKHVVFADLPKTSTGKIQKFELRAVAKLMGTT